MNYRVEQPNAATKNLTLKSWNIGTLIPETDT